jgi:hypothetical protein
MAKSQKTAKKQAANAKNRQKDISPDGQHIQAFPPNEIRDMKTAISDNEDEFKRLADNRMTADERRRKVGAGAKNYGFIDKVSDIATSNPEFAKLFDISDLKNCIRNIEDCRDVVILLQSFSRLVSNAMMVYSDEAYSMALLYYNSAKEIARRGDPNAMEVFRALQKFFHRTKPKSDKPTVKKAKRDFNAIVKGTRDGEVYAENEKARMVGGKRVIVDKTRNNKDSFKETDEGEVV